MVEEAPQMILRPKSLVLAMNLLLCAAWVGLSLPLEALLLPLAVRYSVAEERGRRRTGRWQAGAALDEEAGWSFGQDVAMPSAQSVPFLGPSSVAVRLSVTAPFQIQYCSRYSPHRRRRPPESMDQA